MRLLLIAAILVANQRPADACSVRDHFQPPTNFELVTTTPRIVVAKAKAAQGREIELEITSVLKGPGKPGDTLRVMGQTMRYLGASTKGDFSRARKGAFAGSCVALDYKLDKHYVIFLVEDEGRWVMRGDPFTRVNEEVDPKDDPWIAAVKKYIELGKLSSTERQKAFVALLAASGKPTATLTDKAIALDISAHVAAPTPYKTFAELDAMYRTASPDDRGAIVIAIGKGGDRAALGFMKNVVSSVRTGAPEIPRATALDAIAAYYEKVTDPPVLGQIAEIYVGLGKAAQNERWDVMWLLIHRADASHQALMERALAGASDEEAAHLATWFASSPSETARKDVAKRVGGAYMEKWQLAISLAGLGDKDIIAWATKELGAKKREELHWVALYAIAVSPLPAADALAAKVMAAGGEDLVSMIQGYQSAHHANVDRRLAEIGKLGLSTEARTWLDRTIAQRKRAAAN